MRDAWRRPAPCDRHRCMLHNEWCFICSVHVTCHDYVPACLLQLVWYYFDCWILYSSANRFIQWIYCASIVRVLSIVRCCGTAVWFWPAVAGCCLSSAHPIVPSPTLVHRTTNWSSNVGHSLLCLGSHWRVDNTEKQTTREMEKTWSLNRVLVRYQSLPEFTGLCNALYHCHIVD